MTEEELGQAMKLAARETNTRQLLARRGGESRTCRGCDTIVTKPGRVYCSDDCRLDHYRRQPRKYPRRVTNVGAAG